VPLAEPSAVNLQLSEGRVEDGSASHIFTFACFCPTIIASPKNPPPMPATTCFSGPLSSLWLRDMMMPPRTPDEIAQIGNRFMIVYLW